MPSSPWLGPDSAALGRAQTPNNDAAVVPTAPCCSPGAAVGQGLDNLPFSVGKPLLGCWHTLWQAPENVVQRAASPLPSHPFLSGTVSQRCPGVSFHKRKTAGWFLTQSLRSSAHWLPASLRSGLFLAFHFTACTSIPNPLQPSACVPCGAAQHVLFTVWTSH